MIKDRLENREIRISNLFWTVCIKWRVLLISALLFGVLFTGLSYLKSLNDCEAYKKSIENPLRTEDVTLSSDLSPTAKVYLEYLDQYAAEYYYLNNSILMKLDPNGFFKGEISFYVDNHFKVEYPAIDQINNVDAMVSTYWAVLNDSDVLRKVGEIVGLNEKDASYAAEIVDVRNRYGALNTIGSTANDGFFTVSVYGEDEITCERVLNVVEDAIQSQKSVVFEKYGNHDLILMTKKVLYTADSGIISIQRDQLERLRDFNQRMIENEKYLSDEDKVYIQAYKNELGMQEETDEEIATERVMPTASVSKKWSVVGVVFGIVFAAVWVLITYLFGGKVRVEEDLDSLFGVNVLGSVKCLEKRRNALDDLLMKQLLRGRHLFGKEEALELASTNISIMSRKANVTKVYLVGALYDSKEKDLYSDLRNKLKSNGIELESGRSILYDAKSLERAAEIGDVIIACVAGVSLISEIAEELDLCINQKSNVLGLLVVE